MNPISNECMALKMVLNLFCEAIEQTVQQHSVQEHRNEPFVYQNRAPEKKQAGKPAEIKPISEAERQKILNELLEDDKKAKKKEQPKPVQKPSKDTKPKLPPLKRSLEIEIEEKRQELVISKPSPDQIR